MKTITEPKKNIMLLWHHPKSIENDKTVFRPLRFLLQAKVEDGILLYNIVTSELIFLDDREAQIFERLPADYCSEMDNLIAKRFVVPYNFDENKSVRELRAIIKKTEPSNRITGFTILPTTDCNARCFYCFESDFDRCTMTERLASDVVEYIALKGKMQPVDISWFGGEPLVASKRISQICAGLTQKGIKFSSTMVTNAYLFDEELIKIAKNNWKLRNVQITLDGTEKTYNDTKAYVNPRENPYRRVLKNIEGLLNYEIAVNIRLNVTDENLSDLNDLIDELAERFGENKMFSCYSHAVYEDVGFDPLKYDHDYSWIDSQTVTLDTNLRKKKLLGNLSRLPTLKTIHCMTDNDSCVLIYPDGKIGKCDNKSSSDNIGDIYHGITDEKMNELYKAVTRIPECEECCLFPNCINLTLCPETGRCTKTKVDWKVKRYTALMKNAYQQYLDSGLEQDNNKIVGFSECEG